MGAFDLTNRHCVVVGGGMVALRKLNKLLDAGADVTVVSPEVVEPMIELEKMGRVKWRDRPYQDGDLSGAWMVVAATNCRDVNQRVAEEAERLRVWCNVADDGASTPWAMPAIVRRGGILIALSSGGHHPGVAKALREELESDLQSGSNQFIRHLQSFEWNEEE
jgi:siroheme synthase-like protein